MVLREMPIVAELPYEVTDPTISSQIIDLRAAGADVFFNVTTPKICNASNQEER
jgi:hypothetical protein